MRPVSLITILFSLLPFLISCEQNNAAKNFHPFYKATVNRSKLSVEACGTSGFVAEYLKDTAMYVGFGCGGQTAGFYFKGKIVDGTYVLDGTNVAFYSKGTASYSTDNINKGTLTIRTGNHQAVAGVIPFIEGEFSFEAVDKSTGAKVSITHGTYLFEKRYY